MLKAADVSSIGQQRGAVSLDLAAWMATGVAVAICFGLQGDVPWLLAYPDQWTLPLASWINVFMLWFVEHLRWLFQAITWVLSWPMNWIRDLLEWLPWPATLAGFTVLAYVSAGWRLAAFTAASLFYMVLIGYWPESMNTLALVFVSVPMAVGLGLTMGIACYKSVRANRVIQPTLDVMQTLPTFAYLVPILLLFGFGPVVGLIASAIYACPPMVRNVILGLQRVPSDIVESGVMSGATRRQLLWWVEVPTALPTIMIGVNQTVMAALSMVIIAAIIGSSADIGWEVLSTMRKAAFGPSLLAGIVIALIAMIMDRISLGFTDPSRLLHSVGTSLWERHRATWVALISMTGLVALAQVIPAFQRWPDDLVWYPAQPISDTIDYLIVNYPAVTGGIKKAALFFFLLPINVGLQTVVRPFSWGFELTPTITAGYSVGVVVLSVLATRLWGWRAAVAVLLAGGLFYFGVSKTPWLAFTLIVGVLACQVGGWRLGLFALLGLLFIASTGMWTFAMRSVYLCGAAVFTCFVVGTSIGVWSAGNDTVSAFVRPINDTLQTMPLFVFLIPVLMFFQVGEFTAYLAIIMYAVVPAIRYTEHGLRSVPPEIIEAATSIGCTRRQMLWEVKLPLAIPEIMLGLNQTIMFGLAMLVITALVGTKGLGQQIYIALTSGDTGKGVVAGLGITLIAMITDRIIQAWAKQKKAALGVA